MSKFFRLLYLGVVVTVLFGCNPKEEHHTDADSTSEKGDLDDTSQTADWLRVVKQNRRPRTTPAEPMPPTSCRSVEPVPKQAGNSFGPNNVHEITIYKFTSASGFGPERFAYRVKEDKFIDRLIDRVELVSLLSDDKPSVYLLDENPTVERVRQAKRRPLDEFELLGLEAMRRGEELVWSREAPTRMFGAIRAEASCLKCHTKANERDLLGAFTYYLNMPVDRIRAKSSGMNE